MLTIATDWQRLARNVLLLIILNAFCSHAIPLVERNLGADLEIVLGMVVTMDST